MDRKKRNLRGATVGPSTGPSPSYRKWPQEAEKNPKFNTVMLAKELRTFVNKQQKNGMESSNPVIRAMYNPDAVDKALEYRLLCCCYTHSHKFLSYHYIISYYRRT